MSKLPAGAGYHDPPLYLLEEAKKMPPEVQDWVQSLAGQGLWIAEFQLNLVGVANFVEQWEYQRDYVEYMLNF